MDSFYMKYLLFYQMAEWNPKQLRNRAPAHVETIDFYIKLIRASGAYLELSYVCF